MINILNGMFWNVFILKMIVGQEKCITMQTNISKTFNEFCYFAMIVNDVSFILIKSDSWYQNDNQ